MKTLVGLIRKYFGAVSGRKRREAAALERTFQLFRFRVGARRWTRAELHERR